ncbi:helix-turn-helix domain-containing protein [Pedobacter sp. L105]|uniref:helix-turn-helix domain-containing protein n=1 Tax=Pedobacter sp. L105 TaxID=1641871 RepID=UPI00131CF464|nr:helix-turn-helix domain-containing protein [Pedobacter sp. L105]
MKSSAIIVHKDELKSRGVEIKSFSELKQIPQTPHRDDHYMFIIQQKGFFLWELDFKTVSLSGPSLCFLAPGQVHHYLNYDQCEGWLVFVDNEVISGQYRDIFDTYLNTQQSVSVQNDHASFSMLPILENLLKKSSIPLQKTIINSLIESLTGLIALQIVQSKQSLNLIGGQKYNTVIRFKRTVSAKRKQIKQVKAYASLLHITPLYLNQIVKEITGFSASYWITQEILLEAKRILYYSTLDVKQVAYELGYDDHAYFSRFFKKNTGMTALDFRNSKPLFVQS